MASPTQFFRATFETFLKGSLPAYVMFDLGCSPEVGLTSVPVAPIFMPQSVMRKALNKHQIASEVLRGLPAAVNNPKRIYRSKQDDKSVVLVTDLNWEGDSVVAACLYGPQPDLGLVYLVKSVHHRMSHHFPLWDNEGLLLHKRKEPKSSSAGLSPL